jgi:tyrosinase
MNNAISTRLSTPSCVAAALLLTGCATLPPCPGSLLPIVEVQVNNTASNHDDYGSTTSSTSAQARITNPNRIFGGRNFPGGVAVEIRAPLGLSNLTYSTSPGGTASASLFQTLPEDGGWSPFFVRGTTSTAEKGAIIEIATSGACDEVVIARKAMMIPSGVPPIPVTPARPRVEIEVGSVATIDDYVTWSPTSARVRWVDGTPTATLNVLLRNLAGGDRLRFADGTLAGGDTAVNSTLPLTLNGDGSWVSFFIAGNFASPSTSDKDAILEVVNTSTEALLSRDALMVRIRKNANNLTNAERDRYLQAVQKVSATYGDYIEFVRTHSRSSTGANGSLVAHRQAHSGSAFLPWHRAFVLHLERILQAADPAVALHYWKFDSPAPNMFTTGFMGANSTGNFATLAATNPVISWTLPGEGVATGIQRRTPYGDSGNPLVASDTTVLGLGSPTFDYSGLIAMEVSAHNPAHFRSGFSPGGQPDANTSWVGSFPSIAPRDPLFFFLHSNVDRLWARWQWLHARHAPTAVASYDLQGSHATPAAGVAAPSFTQNANGQITSNRTLGQYAEDTMWPWDNVVGGTGTAGRPDIAILTPFPIVLSNLLPLGRPTVGIVIDYASVTATNPLNGMGFAYDDTNPFD